MTKKEKILNMFRDEMGWKTGIRNGLTILQILDKLGIKPQSHAEIWDEKRKVMSFVCQSLPEYFLKEKIFFCGLPFSRRLMRIYFIPETEEETKRCMDYLVDRYNTRKRNFRYELQQFRNCIRKSMSDPSLSEKEREECRAFLNKCYERMDT